MDKELPKQDNKPTNKRICWHSGCKHIAFLEAWTGYRYCFKHWKFDYKYGSCVGLWKAIKWTKIY